MFERFTGRARAALVHAQEEARRVGRKDLETEHVLVGLLVDAGSVAARVLAPHGLTADNARAWVDRLLDRAEEDDGASSIGDAEALASIGIDLGAITGAVEAAFGEGALDRGRQPRRLGTPRFTADAKKLVELSLREALSLGHNYIGTEHLLLAIVRLGRGGAYEIVAATVPDLENLRTSVLEELRRLRPGA